jgi:hypothetical protein
MLKKSNLLVCFMWVSVLLYTISIRLSSDLLTDGATDNNLTNIYYPLSLFFLMLSLVLHLNFGKQYSLLFPLVIALLAFFTLFISYSLSALILYLVCFLLMLCSRRTLLFQSPFLPFLFVGLPLTLVLYLQLYGLPLFVSSNTLIDPQFMQLQPSVQPGFCLGSDTSCFWQSFKDLNLALNPGFLRMNAFTHSNIFMTGLLTFSFFCAYLSSQDNHFKLISPRFFLLILYLPGFYFSGSEFPFVFVFTLLILEFYCHRLPFLLAFQRFIISFFIVFIAFIFYTPHLYFTFSASAFFLSVPSRLIDIIESFLFSRSLGSSLLATLASKPFFFLPAILFSIFSLYFVFLLSRRRAHLYLPNCANSFFLLSTLCFCLALIAYNDFVKSPLFVLPFLELVVAFLFILSRVRKPLN